MRLNNLFFINPAARKTPKRLCLRIDFAIETQDDQLFDENDPTFKAMKEGARQLGLELKEES